MHVPARQIRHVDERREPACSSRDTSRACRSWPIGRCRPGPL